MNAADDEKDGEKRREKTTDLYPTQKSISSPSYSHRISNHHILSISVRFSSFDIYLKSAQPSHLFVKHCELPFITDAYA